MILFSKLDDIVPIATAHGAGIKKVLSSGRVDLTRVTQMAWGSLMPGEEIPLHLHPDMEECFFFTKGSGLMIIAEQEFELTENVFVTVPPNTSHLLKCSGAALEFFYVGLQVY